MITKYSKYIKISLKTLEPDRTCSRFSVCNDANKTKCYIKFTKFLYTQVCLLVK